VVKHKVLQSMNKKHALSVIVQQRVHGQVQHDPTHPEKHLTGPGDGMHAMTSYE
jgi:hypothetical protein